MNAFTYSARVHDHSSLTGSIYTLFFHQFVNPELYLSYVFGIFIWPHCHIFIVANKCYVYSAFIRKGRVQRNTWRFVQIYWVLLVKILRLDRVVVSCFYKCSLSCACSDACGIHGMKSQLRGLIKGCA